VLTNVENNAARPGKNSVSTISFAPEFKFEGIILDYNSSSTQRLQKPNLHLFRKLKRL
jgi:hypothetical protein